MRTLCAFVLLCCVCAASHAADAALVLRDDGYYLLSADSTQLVKVGHVIDQRTTPGTPLPTPDAPGDEPTERANQIAKVTKGTGTREEAVTLASVVRSLADRGVSGQVAWDTAFRITLNRVSGVVTPQWEDWKAKVDGLAVDYSPQFFGDVAAGISIAHDLDAGAVQAVAAGSANADLGLGREEIKLPEILALIKMILELLRDLGVFDGDTGAFLPPVRFRFVA